MVVQYMGPYSAWNWDYDIRHFLRTKKKKEKKNQIILIAKHVQTKKGLLDVLGAEAVCKLSQVYWQQIFCKETFPPAGQIETCIITGSSLIIKCLLQYTFETVTDEEPLKVLMISKQEFSIFFLFKKKRYFKCKQ